MTLTLALSMAAKEALALTTPSAPRQTSARSLRATEAVRVATWVP